MKTFIFYTQAYNAEAYLEKTINSVLTQTYKNFIYYIADDGSKDNTRKVIEKYAAIDSRIVPVYHDTNTYIDCYNEVLDEIYKNHDGYFAFLDADDEYLPGFAEQGVRVLEQTKSDLFICGNNFVNGAGIIKGTRQWTLNELSTLNTTEISRFFPQIHCFFRTMWGKAYRLELLKEKNLHLSKSLRYGYDTAFVFDYLSNARSLAITKSVLHNYLSDGTTGSYRYFPGRFQCDEILYDATRSFLKQIQGETIHNLQFLSLVHINAIRDTLIVELQEYQQSAISLAPANAAIEDSRFRNSWNMDGDCATRINVKKYLVKALFKSYRFRKDDDYFFYNMLAVICPELTDFWDVLEFYYFFNVKQVALPFFLGDFYEAKRILQQLRLSRYKKDQKIFLLKLKIYLEISCDNSYELVSNCVDAHVVFTEKQQRFICRHHLVLKNIENAFLIFTFPTLAKNIFKDERELAFSAFQTALRDSVELHPDIALVLCRIGICFSALWEKADEYLYFCKAELIILVTLEQFVEFKNRYLELVDLIPEDEDLAELKMYL